MNKAVITQVHHMNMLFIYEDDVLVECHPLLHDKDLHIGDIYIGRVEKVVKNIQSAFIRLDADNVGYLPLDDKPAMILNRQLPKGLPSIAENDLILVQIEQDAQKTKQARVTGNICLNGKYIAMDLQTGFIGVSKKITDKERVATLRTLVKSEYGCVYRTACENATDDSIISEYTSLKNELDELIHHATYERKTGCIKEGKPQYQMILEGYGIDRFDEIKTDQSDLYQTLVSLGYKNVVFYEEKEYPLSKLLSLETELSHILSKKVWLKSGGFLVIEPTEAMVVIDVNSGKSIGKKNKENHTLKINLEAAKEAARQLRLRNLSGIIMIDFINMQDQNAKQEVVNLLLREFKKDKNPTYFVEVTKLDLFELTRKKNRRPLHEILKGIDFVPTSY